MQIPEPEHLSGPKTAEIIAWLATSHTLIKVSLPVGDYEGLTMIIETDQPEGHPVFQIDPPEGLIDEMSKGSQSEPMMLHFEFAGEDRLPHRFETPVASINAQHLWLHYPAEIQRLQLRDNFRIKAPSNAELVVPMEDRNIHMAVDNISRGGAFCHCSNVLKLRFSMGMSCDRLKLSIHMVGGSHTMAIDRAVVRRIERRVRPKHFGVAFEFTKIRPEARKQLTKIIYDLHRQFLKNRIKSIG